MQGCINKGINMTPTEFTPDEGCDYQILFDYDQSDCDDDYCDDEYWYEILIKEIDNIISSYPVELEAVNSNWRGQTGTATANSATQIASKCLSFGNDSLSLRLNSDGYYFRTSSHDRPTGFNIYINPIEND